MEESQTDDKILYNLSLSVDRDNYFRRTCDSCGRDFKTKYDESDLAWAIAPQIQRDENVYLIKHNIRGNNLSNLAREWICYLLFKQLGVSIPKAELLYFEPMKFREELSPPLTGRFKKTDCIRFQMAASAR